MKSYLDTTARNRPLMMYAWSGSSVVLVSNDGTTGTLDVGGFWFRLTRFLSRISFEIEGELPFLCSAAQVSPHVLEFSYTFPPVTAAISGGAAGGSGTGGQPSKLGLLTRTLDVMLRYEVRPGALDITAAISNRWDETAELSFSWILDSDYAGVGEAIARKRQQTARVEQTRLDEGVELSYQHDQLPFRTRVIPRDGLEWTKDGPLHPVADESGGSGEARLTAQLRLSRQQRVDIRLRVEADDFQDPLDESGREHREKERQRWLDNLVTVHTPGETPLVALTNRGMEDLGSMALLEGSSDEWLYPGAGVPLYQNAWGRDALTATWQAGSFDGCEMLGHVLHRLRRTQGTAVNHDLDEEPGRILNRHQPQPTSRLGIDPFLRYYGDFASSFMYVIGLGQFFAWTGDKEALASHWDTGRRILDWAREYGDRDGDGYVDYLTHAEQGPKHQGWKDADNAVVYEDGRQVEPPIATCEVQGYWFSSLQFMAIFGAILGETDAARSYWNEAVALKERFNRDFWLEEEGSVAFGLDSKKELIRTVTSNAGHCLTAGIIDTDRIPRQARRLFERDMFSGWGIRTISSDNPAFNPLSYHLGSVWPVENGTILLGLRRYGIDDRVVELARALYDLALLWAGGRIPECVGGYDRFEHGHPGVYPQANSPQCWNQTIWPLVMQSLLGLQPAALFRTLTVDPILPWWLPDVTLRDLRVGDAKVTIHFWRDGDGKSHYEIVRKEGTLHVLRQPPINDITASLWDRLVAAATGSG